MEDNGQIFLHFGAWKRRICRYLCVIGRAENAFLPCIFLFPHFFPSSNLLSSSASEAIRPDDTAFKKYKCEYYYLCDYQTLTKVFCSTQSVYRRLAISLLFTVYQTKVCGLTFSVFSDKSLFIDLFLILCSNNKLIMEHIP